MPPKDFRKISHPEPKILNSLVNCRQTHRHTWVNLEPTTKGGSAKNHMTLCWDVSTTKPPSPQGVTQLDWE